MSQPGAATCTPEAKPPDRGDWHALPVDRVFALLRTGPSGLGREEAARRLAELGPNELRREAGASPLLVFVGQFREALTLLLLGAGVISILLGEVLDAVVILAIVLLSGFLGFLQEYRASKALEALKQLAAPLAEVIRAGQTDQVPARELVPGDLVVLAAGDRVPADLRVVEAYNLRAAEASLTGEPEPANKETTAVPLEASLGDRADMLYAGTAVVYGRGAGVAVATGMATEFGKIAELVQAPKQERTPLEIQMEVVGRWLGAAGLAIVVLVVGLGLLRGDSLLPTLLWGVSLAVAAVPEALPAVVTGALTVGVQRMARRHAIVRRLPAVETLGATTVICTDKTGTLTSGEMTVRRIWLPDRALQVTGVGYNPRGEILQGSQRAGSGPGLTRLLRVAVLCNDARLQCDEASGRYGVGGDPTEAALLVVAAKAGVELEPLRLAYPRVDELPFTARRKLMMTLNRAPEGAALVCAKGAPEVILGHCSHYQIGDEVRPLGAAAHAAALAEGEEFAGGALRVLGLAYRELPEAPERGLEGVGEQELVFCGLVAMSDPPRPEVGPALRQAEAAGVRTVMVTGDHLRTAEAVAGELGILRDGQLALVGRELDRLSDAELDALVGRVAVYARASPEHKLRIVDAFRRRHQVVAMTGDGLNDAPALRRADVGVAMGVAGTEVSREAADLVLADDNFATIVAAMEEGRGIYDNVKKYLAYLLSSNAGELLVMLAAGLLGLPLPLIAVQILWANLVTDGLPAIALGIERPEPAVMRRPPRPRGESVFTLGVLMLILVVGTLMAVAVLAVFAREVAGEDGALVRSRTLAFTLIVMFEMFNAFNCRSERDSLLRVGILGNRWLVLAVAASVLLQLGVLYIPALQPVFGVTSLSLADWLLILALSATVVLAVELGKLVLRGDDELPMSNDG